MELEYNYLKIKKIAKEVRKSYKMQTMVEMVQYIFSDEDVLSMFVREGADLKSNAEADEYIGKAMSDGMDYFEVQQEVVKGLISANFYKKELTEMLKNLTVSEEVANS